MRIFAVFVIIYEVLRSLSIARGELCKSQELHRLDGSSVQNSERNGSGVQYNLTCSEETNWNDVDDNKSFGCWCIQVCHEGNY